VGFTKATKKKAKLRFAITGPAGSGKTYSALAIASAMGGRVAVIDTEHGSASKYADLFEFDVLELTTFAPANYVNAIHEAEAAGYENIVVDSLSHAWMGKGGALEMVDKATKASRSGNSYMAWGEVTPEQNKLIEAMLACRANLFATMRSKTEYVLEEQTRNGRTVSVPRKVGMAPVQRDGVEYEFDVIGDLNINNAMSITKTRCPALSGQSFDKPGADVAALLTTWLTDGAEVPAPKLTDGLASGLRVEPEDISTLREWLDSTATDEAKFLEAFGKRGTGLEGPAVDAIEKLNPAQYEAGLALLKKKSEQRATA
jgi:KaiC/GvpD/RAD55 family RecA-like ATPase